MTWKLFLFCRAVKESNLQPADEQLKFRGFGNFKPNPFFIRLRLNTRHLAAGMIGLRLRLRPDMKARRTAPTCPDEVLTKSEAR